MAASSVASEADYTSADWDSRNTAVRTYRASAVAEAESVPEQQAEESAWEQVQAEVQARAEREQARAEREQAQAEWGREILPLPVPCLQA